MKKEKTIDPNKKANTKTGKVVLSLVLALVVLIVAALAWLNRDEAPVKTTSENNFSVSESKSYEGKTTGKELSSVEIAKKVKPSVVAVVTYQKSTKSGEGSGVVMSVDKEKNRTYILTCAHIVNKSGITCQVQLEDGTDYDAKVVGYDTRSDVGVLSIKGTDLTPAEFGDSSVLQVGEPVYAIGNPGGTQFYGSFTAGVVSAIDRPTSASGSGYTMECIQHDASINPGNSGGALVNSYGQVIGINSSKIEDEDYEGMGFAIPSVVARSVVDDILSVGYVQDRAKLGVGYIAASSHETYSIIVQANHLPAGAIVVAEIDDDSCLKDTKVEEGDLVIAANGKELDTSDVLLSLIEKSKPGDKVKLTFVHVNDDYTVEQYDVTVTLTEDRGN